MGFWKQFCLIVRKNFILYKRQPLRVTVEVLWPLVLFIILAAVRTRPNLLINKPECHFDAKAMPSAGLVPFVRSMICSWNNTCYQEARENAHELRNQTLAEIVTDAFDAVNVALSNDTLRRALANGFTEARRLIATVDRLRKGLVTDPLSQYIFNGSDTILGFVRSSGIPIDNTSISALLTATSLNLSRIVSSLPFIAEVLTTNSSFSAAGVGNYSDPQSVTSSPSSSHSVTDKPASVQARATILSIFSSGSYAGNSTFVMQSYKNMLCGNESILVPTTPAAEKAIVDVCNLSASQLSMLSRIVASNIDKGLLLPDPQFLADLSEAAKDLIRLPAISDLFNTDSGPMSMALSDLYCSSNVSDWLILGDATDNLTVAGNSSTFNGSSSTDQPTPKPDNSSSSSDPVMDDCIARFAPLGDVIFRQVEPLLFGKIPYAPSSPRTDAIIRSANGTFQAIADITALTAWFAEASSSLLRNLGTLIEGLEELAAALDRLAPMDPSVARLAASLRAAAELLQQNGTLVRDLTEASRVASTVAPYLSCFSTDKFEPWPDETSLVNRSLRLIDANRYWAALVFNDTSPYPVNGRKNGSINDVSMLRQQPQGNSTSSGESGTVQLPSYISYKIRMNTDKVDSTRRIEDKYWRPLPRRNPVFDLKYITYGFAYIQDMVEHAIISLHAQALGSSLDRATPSLAAYTGVYLQQFPYPCYIQDNFASAVSRTMPLFMVLAWLFSVAMTVKGVVYEKQERLREAMKIVGLTPAAHWTAWFVSSFAVMTASVVLLVFLVKYGRVIEMSDPSVVLLFMLCFVVATISQAFLLSSFFLHANLAACCAALVFFCLYLPYTLLVQWEEVLSTSEKSLACLLSSVAFGFGCSYLARYEEQGVGAQWSNIAVSPIADDSFNLLRCMIMMLVDAAIYLILLWYIENVFPGKYGVPKPWYFVFTRSYWNCRRGRLERGSNGRSATYRIGETYLPQPHSANEAEPCGDGTLGVSIRKLRKVYSTGKKVAVDGLSLNFYEDQITSFLGHNGAGKTTTMSILCGLFPPTSGTAVIYGLDIRQDMDEIRKSLGFCPQHNILFDNMTVEEHILFYAQLKGEDLESARAEMESMLVEVGLKPKQHELSRNLSGGMKRKLSVMMSFVGGSKCVILDEPTAGVDPYSRRQIWELLLKFKKGRTVILSTHHMDEADFLGDRIAIISQGKLCCVGSSLYLKSRYGSGYYLTVILNDAAGLPSARGTSLAENVIKFVKERIPEAHITSEHRSELCIQLPSSGTRDGSFSRLFKDMDDNMENLSIRTYGISDTTLEEIFLKVADESGLDMEESLKKLTDDGQLPCPPSRLSIRRRGLRGVLRKLRERLTSTKQVCTQHFLFSGSVQTDGERNAGQRWPEELPMSGDVVPTFSVARNEAVPAGLLSSGETPTSDSAMANNVNGPDRRTTTTLLRSASSGEVLSDVSLPLPVPTEGTTAAAMESTDDVGSQYASVGMATVGNSFVTAATTRRRSGEGVLDDRSVDTDDDVDAGDDDFVDCSQQNRNNGSSTQREPRLSTVGMTSESKLRGVRLHLQQFRALIVKRFHHVRRNKKAFFCEILLPAVFITLALTFALLLPPIDDEPALELQPWMYQPRVGSPHLTAFYSNDAGSSAFAKEIELMVRDGQYGTRCMDPAVYTIDGRPCVDYSDDPEAKAWTSQPNVPRYEDLPVCSCETGFQQCPANASGPAASHRLLNNTDYMLNMTGRNLSDWLVKTMQPYIKRRYGGFSFESDLQKTPNLNMSFISDLLHSLAPQVSIEPPVNAGDALQRVLSTLSSHRIAKVWFDNKGWASSVSYMNAMNNVLLRVLARENGLDPRRYGITAINHPMKMTDDQLVEALLNRGWLAVVITICVIFALSLIPATFVLYLIEDRHSTSKHLQFVSGMSRFTYWLGSFTWDMLNYIAAASICFAIFAAFNEQAYVSPINAPCLAVLLLTYGWAMVPAMYPFSFVFSVPSTAFVVLSCLNIFLGVTSTVGTFILEMFPDDPYLNDIGHVLRSVFLILPHYCLGRGLIDISIAHVRCRAYTTLTDKPCYYDPFEWTTTGRNIMALCIMGVLYFALILLIEYWSSSSSDCCVSCKLKHASKRAHRHNKGRSEERTDGDEEEDVHKERLRVLNGHALDDVLRVDNAVKVYRTARGKSHVAVDGLTFGVRKSECFGLLGVNGAGKTSTFKMLTGETNFTGGNAFVNHHSVRASIAAVYEDLGYCPQFDALDMLLTGRQHLEFYARLRGVPEQQVAVVADDCISRMNLKRYQDKLVGSYSGGNKRKLQAAIALIGNPAVVFLDEPTTGMDPKARRFLWNCIKGMVLDGRAVVLTSHSMEECEALCHRIGIMVNGRFQCMGSSQHLKNKYGSGYVLSLRAAAGSADTGELLALKRAIHDRFCGLAELTEENRDILHYRIAGAGPATDDHVDVTLADLFGGLESLRTEFQLEDHSVCQTSLDHVFVRFASHQSDEPGCVLAEGGSDRRFLKANSGGRCTRLADQPAVNDPPYDSDGLDRVSVAGSDLSAADSQMNLIV